MHLSRLPGWPGFCLHLQKAVSVGVRWVETSAAAHAIWRGANERGRWRTPMFVCFFLSTAGRMRAGSSLLDYILFILQAWHIGACKFQILILALSTSLCLISGVLPQITIISVIIISVTILYTLLTNDHILVWSFISSMHSDNMTYWNQWFSKLAI